MVARRVRFDRCAVLDTFVAYATSPRPEPAIPRPFNKPCP